jgi:ATP-dependent Lon protease
LEVSVTDSAAGEAPDVNQLLPVLPVADACLFPDSALELTVTAQHALRAIDVATRTGGLLLIVAQREPDGKLRDIFDVGTVASIVTVEPFPDGSQKIELMGRHRGRCVSLTGMELLVAEVEPLPDGDAGEEWEGAVEPLARFLHAHHKLRAFLEERRRSREPMAWINLVCQHLPIKLATRQQLLESRADERCKKIGRVLDTLLQKKEQGA